MPYKGSTVAYWLVSLRDFCALCCFIMGLTVVLMVHCEKKSKVVAVVCLLMGVWTGVLSEEIMSLYNDSSVQWWYILLHRGLQSRTNPRNWCVCVFGFQCVQCFYFLSGWRKEWLSKISSDCVRVSLYACLPINVILSVTSVSYFC